VWRFPGTLSESARRRTQDLERETPKLLKGIKMQQIIPIAIRGVERCIIAIGAIFTIYLGYKLFVRGIGTGKLAAKMKFIDIVLSGSGPGLFFMAFGAIILLVGEFSGEVHTGATAEYITREKATPSATTINLPTDKELRETSKERNIIASLPTTNFDPNIIDSWGLWDPNMNTINFWRLNEFWGIHHTDIFPD
jgi:hypothetical protein